MSVKTFHLGWVIVSLAFFSMGQAEPLSKTSARKNKPVAVYFAKKKISLDKLPKDFPEDFKKIIDAQEGFLQNADISVVCDASTNVVFFTGGPTKDAERMQKDIKTLVTVFEKKFGETKKQLGAVPFALLYKAEQADAFLNWLMESKSPYAAWAEELQKTPFLWHHNYFPVIAMAKFYDREAAIFDGNNQVVHQMAHLLLQARFGTLPPWIEEPLCWNLEREVREDIHIYCHRQGQITVSEQTGWLNRAKAYVSKQDGFPSMEEVILATKYAWDERCSTYAYGVTQYLLSKKLSELANYLREYSVEFAKQYSKAAIEELRPEFQIELMKNTFGQDFEMQAAKFIATAKE